MDALTLSGFSQHSWKDLTPCRAVLTGLASWTLAAGPEAWSLSFLATMTATVLPSMKSKKYVDAARTFCAIHFGIKNLQARRMSLYDCRAAEFSGCGTSYVVRPARPAHASPMQSSLCSTYLQLSTEERGSLLLKQWYGPRLNDRSNTSDQPRLTAVHATA